jgi:uncharacterized membrane protein
MTIGHLKTPITLNRLKFGRVMLPMVSLRRITVTLVWSIIQAKSTLFYLPPGWQDATSDSRTALDFRTNVLVSVESPLGLNS